MNEQEKDKRIEDLEQKVEQLSRMLVKSFGYAGQDPDTFLQNARKTTEAICRFIYTKEKGEPTKKMMLNDYGRALKSEGIIPDRIAILIGTIQTYGNFAAHAQEDLSESSNEWIAPCQTALANLTNWFFLDYIQGDVPKELVQEIESYKGGSVEPPKKVTEAATEGGNKKVFYAIAGLAAIIIIGLLWMKFGNNTDGQDETQNQTVENNKPIKAQEDALEQQEQLVEEMNKETNPNARRIAVLYFDNSGDSKELSQLRKGLAAMLISDLSKVNMLSVVEREKMQEILEEQNMNNSERFDAATAAKIGKLLGAQHILTGAFFEMMGTLRIDARIIDVETGKVQKSEGVDGAAADFFSLEKQLVTKLLSGLNVELTDEEKSSLKEAKNQRVQNKSFKAYSKALDEMDQGNTSKAIELLEKVVQDNPDFEPAQKTLKKLKVSV